MKHAICILLLCNAFFNVLGCKTLSSSYRNGKCTALHWPVVLRVLQVWRCGGGWQKQECWCSCSCSGGSHDWHHHMLHIERSMEVKQKQQFCKGYPACIKGNTQHSHKHTGKIYLAEPVGRRWSWSVLGWCWGFQPAPPDRSDTQRAAPDPMTAAGHIWGLKTPRKSIEHIACAI